MVFIKTICMVHLSIAFAVLFYSFCTRMTSVTTTFEIHVGIIKKKCYDQLELSIKLSNKKIPIIDGIKNVSQ